MIRGCGTCACPCRAGWFGAAGVDVCVAPGGSGRRVWSPLRVAGRTIGGGGTGACVPTSGRAIWNCRRGCPRRGLDQYGAGPMSRIEDLGCSALDSFRVQGRAEGARDHPSRRSQRDATAVATTPVGALGDHRSAPHSPQSRPLWDTPAAWPAFRPTPRSGVGRNGSLDGFPSHSMRSMPGCVTNRRTARSRAGRCSPR
jgi:hypothetical protein